MNAQMQSLATPALPPVIPDLFPAGSRPVAKLRTREDFLKAARELVPLLKAHTRTCSEIRRPVDEVVAAIVKSGLVGLLRPKKYGGAGLDVSDMAAVAGVLAEGCTSTAWDYDVWEAHNWIMGMLPEKGQEEIFGTDNLVICCGVANPSKAKARPVEGGYMLSGRWAFGSGSTHANWASVGALVEGRQVDGRPEGRFMLVPRPAFSVLDTWQVRGLAGTGTHDIYVADEVFVPEYRTVTRAELVSGTAPGGKLHGTVAYQMPLIPGVHLVTAATSIGAAQAAITEFKEWTSKRVMSGGQKQIDLAAPTARLGAAMVDVEAAKLLLQSTLRELETEVRAGRTLTLELRAKARMVAGYVPDLCKQVITSLVSACGIAAMDERSPLSALLLDVTMMSLHQSTEYDRGTENYGRVVLGLPQSNPNI